MRTLMMNGVIDKKVRMEKQLNTEWLIKLQRKWWGKMEFVNEVLRENYAKNHKILKYKRLEAKRCWETDKYKIGV